MGDIVRMKRGVRADATTGESAGAVDVLRARADQAVAALHAELSNVIEEQEARLAACEKALAQAGDASPTAAEIAERIAFARREIARFRAVIAETGERG